MSLYVHVSRIALFLLTNQRSNAFSLKKYLICPRSLFVPFPLVLFHIDRPQNGILTVMDATNIVLEKHLVIFPLDILECLMLHERCLTVAYICCYEMSHQLNYPLAALHNRVHII